MESNDATHGDNAHFEPIAGCDEDESLAAASVTTLPRRQILRALAGAGIGSLVFQRALAAGAAGRGQVTAEMIDQAQWIAGLELSEEDRKLTAQAVENSQRSFAKLRDVEVGYDVTPAVSFQVVPWQNTTAQKPRRDVRPLDGTVPRRPADDDQLAFLPVSQLAALLRARKVTSVELTKLYLQRLRRFDPALFCVVNYTEELALRQAERADREIAAGKIRGPLHGIPWGAKDLIAVPGYPTTWGATPFRDRKLDTTATVVRRLEEAGAVLVAKLSLGALAQGDRWFGGRTRNPWNTEQGSSGSSAGSAAAVAAGLVGFALGSETWGSIISPCARCGVSGLRPTFGRVSRHGCMALSWSLDKIGPLARTVDDCALILAAIHGFDSRDTTAVDQPFAWPPTRDLKKLRVGYIQNEQKPEQRRELQILEKLGVALVPITLPDRHPIIPVMTILDTEASAVFDSLTRRGVTEGLNRWPNVFRQAQFTPAVEYLRAQRVRTLLMRDMRKVMQQIDLYVGGSDSALTNLTGHPTVVVPNGFRENNGRKTPKSLTFTGRLFGETDLLAVACAYQLTTGHHLQHPPLEAIVPPDSPLKK